MEIKEKINWTESQMPVLMQIRKDFISRKPFKDIKIGVCLHLTKETAILLMTLLDGGADIYACASNPLSTQDDVVEYLREQGIKVWGKNGMSSEEYANGLSEVAKCLPNIVIDDGGDLTKEIHKTGNYPIGGLEETTTGVNEIMKMNLEYPIIAVNNADTKHLFDNVYGTGQSTLDGIIRATNTLLAGKTLVVAGYGNCGKGLAMRAKGMGCNVIITEIDAIKALQATMDGFRVMPMELASFEGDIFVTVTGNRDVITYKDMVNMKENAILANSGHFDLEINVEDAKQFPIKVLAEGRLVNLACAEGHPAEVMDMSFANQALCAEELLKRNLENKVHNVPREIDNKVAEMKLQALGIEIDTLTTIQKEYYV